MRHSQYGELGWSRYTIVAKLLPVAQVIYSPLYRLSKFESYDATIDFRSIRQSALAAIQSFAQSVPGQDIPIECVCGCPEPGPATRTDLL